MGGPVPFKHELSTRTAKGILYKIMAKSSAKASEHSFESALERLEHIVEEMEGDKLPLEELLGRYEEGIRLVKVCQSRISAAEKRIELISRNAAAGADAQEVELTPFDPAAPASATGSAAPAEGTPTAPPHTTGRSSSRAQAKPSDPDEVSLF